MTMSLAVKTDDVTGRREDMDLHKWLWVVQGWMSERVNEGFIEACFKRLVLLKKGETKVGNKLLITKVHNIVYWMNHYQMESAIGFSKAYLLDSYLSTGYH